MHACSERRSRLNRPAAGIALACILACIPPSASCLESTWIYSVQASATVQPNPPQITLSWPQEIYPVVSYAVYRRPAGATGWGSPTTLPGSALSYTDSNVAVGTLYEYQIVKTGGFFTGYGYVTSGIEVPPVDSRGKIVLIVDSSQAAALDSELQTLAQDLAGDGWTVARQDVDRNASPASVRDTIRSVYNADRANVKAVLLLGHVPVARSGNLNVDGHGGRALPSDAFYGDMDGNWTDANGDGIYDPSSLPSDVELEVGRVDFADMPVAGPESLLLQQYLFKDHDYRHALRRPARRALIGDRFGDSGGQGYVAAAYRTFAALFGPDNTVLANADDVVFAGERWIDKLRAADYLWVYGAGGGTDTTLSFLGHHGQYSDVNSADLADGSAKGTFYLLFGSWIVDWSKTDNLMRAALAGSQYGLSAAWSGRPHLYFQGMAMGGTLGQGIRLSQNNSGQYANQVNLSLRGIHIALLGDPTLRLHAVAPPSGLTGNGTSSGVALRWNASSDAVGGYHVYRSANPAGPFTRVSGSVVNGTTFTDTSASPGTYTYQVRAIKLETSASGTYYNTSQGAFTQATATSNPTSQPPVANPPPGDGPVTTPPLSATGSGPGGGGAITPVTALLLALLLVIRHFTERGGRSET